MTKKKRNHPSVEDIIGRPWCYYCERDFDDLKILINHQKAKHFKCERCGRRLNTAGGLSVHMSQVHKENLTAVDNALPNRAGLEIEIFGMEGIPEDVALQHNQRVLTQFHQAEVERRAASGNPGANAQGGNPAKKPKTEDLSDIKKRLAEHKAAKLAAENGGSSGSATPTGAGQVQGQGQVPTQQQTSYQAGSPSHLPYQQAYAPPPSTTTYGQPQTYSPAPTQPVYPFPAYGQPPAPTFGQPPAPMPFQQAPYAQPPQPSFQQAVPYPPQFSPPPFPNQAPFPGQPFPPHIPQNGATPYLGQAGGQPRAFGAGSPISPFPPQQRTQSPAQNGLPQRTGSGSLPSAPGLPQRPAVGAPPVNAFQFQQMHQGQIPVPQNHIVPQTQYTGPPGLHNGTSTVPPSILASDAPNAASIDDLISSASKQADVKDAANVANAADSQTATLQPNAPATTVAPVPSKEETTEGKPVKKDKEKEKAKQTRLVYSDNEISPEEKMAMLPKYAYTPHDKLVTV